MKENVFAVRSRVDLLLQSVQFFPFLSSLCIGSKNNEMGSNRTNS